MNMILDTFAWVVFSIQVVTLPFFECDAILGQWFTENNDGLVEIYKVNDRYYAKLIGGNNVHTNDGITRKDTKNSNERLRTRTLLGILIFEDMQCNLESKRWQGGRVYDPNMGHEAKGIITIVDSNTIEVKGYVGFEWLSKSQIWNRKK